MIGLCFSTASMLLKRLPHSLLEGSYGFHSLFILTEMQGNFPIIYFQNTSLIIFWGWPNSSGIMAEQCITVH